MAAVGERSFADAQDDGGADAQDDGGADAQDDGGLRAGTGACPYRMTGELTLRMTARQDQRGGVLRHLLNRRVQISSIRYYPSALMVIISLAREYPDVPVFRVDGTAQGVPVKVLDVPEGLNRYEGRTVANDRKGTFGAALER